MNETAVGNRYYAINVNTGEQFYVPAEGFYYPRRSADGTIYFKGSGGRVLLLNLPDKQIF